jgi:hypothetical protein
MISSTNVFPPQTLAQAELLLRRVFEQAKPLLAGGGR